MADAVELPPNADGRDSGELSGPADDSQPGRPEPAQRRVRYHSVTGEPERQEASPRVASSTSRPDRNRWDDAREYPAVDPWQVTSYLISGVALWGLIGWAAARWLDIPFLTGVGFIIGGVLGIWLTYIRYGRPQSGSSASVASARSVNPASPQVPVSPQAPTSSQTHAQPDLPRACAPSRSQSAQRPSGPQSSDPTAEEEKP